MGLFRSALVALMLTAATGGYAQEHNTLTEEEQAAGWQLLFNGEDMAQWRNFKKDSLHKKWVVQDGTMTLTKKGGGDIVTREQYGEFELQLEWKISEGGNSGIFVLVSEDGRKVYSKAPEIQILDNERHSDRKDPTPRSGSRKAPGAKPGSPASTCATNGWHCPASARSPEPIPSAHARATGSSCRWPARSGRFHSANPDCFRTA